MRDWIATRELTDGSGRKIVVRLARPEVAPMEGGTPPPPWTAPFVIEIDGTSTEYDAFGVDAFQALIIAHERIRKKLLEAAGISGGFMDLQEPLEKFVQAFIDEELARKAKP